jgi:hypothetical protein
MSSAITVYAVPLDRLKQVVGSGDRAAIDAIVIDTKDFLTSIDDIDDEAVLTCADAVADLVNGEITDDGPGYLYGYALEALCIHIGEELPNICSIVGATQWIAKVDKLLEIKGVPVRLASLVFGASPVPIPTPDDCPCIGSWSASSISAALVAIQSLNMTGLDGEMSETIMQIRSWLETAATSPGVSIVGFLS